MLISQSSWFHYSSNYLDNGVSWWYYSAKYWSKFWMEDCAISTKGWFYLINLTFWTWRLYTQCLLVVTCSIIWRNSSIIKFRSLKSSQPLVWSLVEEEFSSSILDELTLPLVEKSVELNWLDKEIFNRGRSKLFKGYCAI